MPQERSSEFPRFVIEIENIRSGEGAGSRSILPRVFRSVEDAMDAVIEAQLAENGDPKTAYSVALNAQTGFNDHGAIGKAYRIHRIDE